MRNLWLVAKHEYLNAIKEKSFLISTFALPGLIITVMVVGILVVVGGRGRTPVGYVDNAGVIVSMVPPGDSGATPSVQFRAFSDEESGLAALNAEEIQALYVLPPNYRSTRQVSLYYLTRKPGQAIQRSFRAFLRGQLLAQYPVEIRERILGTGRIIVRSVDGNRQFETNNPLSFIVPYAAAFFFVFAVMSSGGYMLQAVTGEKENRTMELLVTSLRPLELIGGKALGLMSVGLSQLLLWFGVASAGILVARRFIEELRGFSFPWSTLSIVAVFFLPTYALISAMMTAIGGIAEDMRQGQQISGTLNLLFTLPFFFLSLIMAKPDSPIVVALTLFPTTAFVTIVFRWGMSVVPFWQLAVSWSLLVLAAAGSVWAAARIFRLGMLNYGQRLGVKHILQALKG